MDIGVHVLWRDNWRHKIEAIDRDNIATRSLQAA